MINSTQDYVITCVGKESRKRVDTNICKTNSLCCTPETHTTLYMNCAPLKFFKRTSL